MTLGQGGSEDTAHAVAALGGRRHHRLACDLPTAFRVRSTEVTGEARTVNIGLGGLRIDLPVEVCLPEDLELRLFFPEAPANAAPEEEVVVLGRVVWTVADRTHAPYPTGVQFKELADRERRRLYELLPRLTK